jgi:teichoic acid transport system ATP-binding protein
MDTSVVFKNVTKKYKMYQKTSDKILDLVLPDGYGKDFYAIQNINFEAKRGEVIGIIGVNGAGKSTMSNLISGVIPPSAGSVEINGNAALISISAGLNNQLTGRDNIELKCLMLGFSKREIQELMPEIIDFADIGAFIDQPVKKYSSGMKSRLGFAISVNIDPDILVIDEALSVGDKTFYQKCIDKMNSFKEKGKTIFFISHSIGQIKEFCQKALWLEAGGVRAYGLVKDVVPLYEQFIKDLNKMSTEERKKFNQYVMEKRSKKQEIDEVNSGEAKSGEEENEKQESTKDNMFLQRSDHFRKKPKHQKAKALYSLLVLVVLIGSSFTYFKWDHLVTYFSVDKKENVLNVEGDKSKGNKTDDKQTQQAEETAKVAAKDIRYVEVTDGYVRDMPDLAASKKIRTVNFGDVITVEQIEKDPVEDFNWLKFKLDTGQECWISEILVSKIQTKVDEKSLISQLGNIVQVDQFDDYLTYFGKTEDELGTAGNSNSVVMTYNGNGQVKEVSVNINTLTSDQIIEQLGEPVLRQEEEKAYLYHGEKFDFIFSTINGSISTFNKMIVKPAIGDENI